MSKLKLRQEFRRSRPSGTIVELTNTRRTGATQVSATDFLEITYPSADALKVIEAARPEGDRPLVVIGERGQGKSHLLAMLHHALTDPAATYKWLHTWADRLDRPELAKLQLRKNMHVISESLHRHNYKHLWDILFERHPHGREVRGMWTGLGDTQTDVPSYEHLLKLFSHTPTALILDEFQTWFDGLADTRRNPKRIWAFNTIQLLSEISKTHPELLVLVLSVRNGRTDAFQQVQRVAPILIDFKGPTAQSDRQRLLLHRLFENRMQVTNLQIEMLNETHVTEFLRLKQITPSEHDRVRQDFVQSWPYAPHLLQLLEDQVLIATHAQETRDLIRILVALFKNIKDQYLITAADFGIDNDDNGILALLDSVSNEHHSKLRERAQRNLTAVREAVHEPSSLVPHLSEIVAALWLRSIAVGNTAGAMPEDLQVDITHDHAIDDNGFKVELTTLVDNSFNIHHDGPRLIFRNEENPQAKLMASARNDKLFTDQSDLEQLEKEIKYAVSGQEDTSKGFKVIVLRSDWNTDPWISVADSDQPQVWDERIPILILPSMPKSISETLGVWIKTHLQTKRNCVRFLIPRTGGSDIFRDSEVLTLARAVVLAERWQTDQSEYARYARIYKREIQKTLTSYFDRYAILDIWNYQDPTKCSFHVEYHRTTGQQILDKIENHIFSNLFVREDFEAIVDLAAKSHHNLGDLLKELREPRSDGSRCIPWLGETKLKDEIIRLCARGRIAIDIRGIELLQARAGEDKENAWKRMRGKLGTGRHLDQTQLLPPQSVPEAGNIATHGSAEPTVLPEQSTTPSTSSILSARSPTVTPFSTALPSADSSESLPDEEATEQPAKNIFARSPELEPYMSERTSPLNLIAEVESWGVGRRTQLREVSLGIAELTGAQLNELLKALPDGITYKLNINKEKS